MFLLNITSLILGLIAWFIPILQRLRAKKQNLSSFGMYSILSFGSCSLSLALQYFYLAHLVEIQDWAALMDITNTLAYVAGLLASVTIILNLMLYLSLKQISIKEI
jgi:cytochrome c oxidase subunit 4